MTTASGLDRLATLAGVEPDYWDIWGNHHPISDAAKRDILAALGFPANDEGAIRAGIEALEHASWKRMLPPVVVVHQNEPIEVPVCLPLARVLSRIDYEVIEESGARHRLVFAPEQAAAKRTIGGEERARVRLRLTVALPLGYHTLKMTEFADGATRIIVAPRSCYLPKVLAEGRQVWGVSAQLYTLRRPGNWGIGDFTDLLAAVDACARTGADLLGLNPLHALFAQHPEWASPYSPASRLFLNPLYIDPEAIPEFATCPEAQTLIRHGGDNLQSLRAASYVDYPAVWQLKLKVLYALFEWFRRYGRTESHAEARHQEFNRFCAEQGEPLRRFALFNALAEQFPGKSWHEWPEPFRSPNSPEVAAFARDHASQLAFHMYVQWNADRQLAAAQARAQASGMAIGLYADLAVGGARESADAWANPETLVQSAKVGCPPDPFNMMGQDWQIPPMHPHRLRELAYEPFIAILRANMRHAGALRIDHAMGMLHLFWIPGDGAPSGGAYVKYPFEDLLAVLALESHRHRCLVVGEDLGTVPDGFRERMTQANVLSYRVLYFEKAGEHYKRPSEYPALSLACISTHDLATPWGYWQGADIDLKQELSQYPSAEAVEDERQARVHDRYLLLKALDDEGLLPPGRDPEDVDGAPMDAELAAALHAYLARSPARILLVQIDDLMQEGEQINLPGTTDERPNWRRKLGGPVEGLPDLPTMKALRSALLARRQVKAPLPDASTAG